MEGEEGGGMRLSKRISNGEVDYKNKSGTAWSHSYLNQKPWHPLSYPNQRRKWIAEQTHSQRQRRAEEVAREYAQEQEFYRQTALISKKDKEKVELMQAVSFMYVRPPGYNAESAKAAEMNDQKKKEDMMSGEPPHTNADGPSSSLPTSSSHLNGEKKKPRPKDVFGRPLPTEEEFEILKNAPRLETGVPGRVKPFGVEVRNVKCLRCGNYGHQSGDRECPLKDAIMPNEESRLKRDDPLNAILAHTDPTEPLKWELKQKPGISPPRGGFKPDDPNQQIVADDIFDEYGGFLNMDNIPDLLTNFSKKPKKSKKSKHKKQKLVHSDSEATSDDGERRSKKKKVKANRKKRDHTKSSSSDTSVSEKDHGKSRHKSSYSSEDSDSDRNDRSRRTKPEHSFSPKGSDHPRHSRSKHGRRRHSLSPEGSVPDGYHRSYKNSDKHFYSSEDSDSDKDDRSRKKIQKHKRKHSRKGHSYSSEDSGPAGYHAYHKNRDEHFIHRMILIIKDNPRLKGAAISTHQEPIVILKNITEIIVLIAAMEGRGAELSILILLKILMLKRMIRVEGSNKSIAVRPRALNILNMI
ncbi:CBF1-interacting co-repressor CIR, N-terminal domain [Sesbania bispinosa]|nr:CBF1-interacting co-repressor CIR, N-terminal domain [Sesbania bispinosa]